MILRGFIVLVVSVLFLANSGTSPASAQENSGLRVETTGAQTLEDILARQRGMKIDAMGSPELSTEPAGLSDDLGTLGAASDSDVYRAFRDGSADLTSSATGPVGDVVMQDGGMWWLQIRRGPLTKYGGYSILAVTAVLLTFYLIRGRILIEGEKTGRLIIRFSLLERIAHWSMAIPFVLLAITGLSLLFGRVALIPLFGKEVYSPIAIVGKFVHNYVAWVFIFGLVLSFVLWVTRNFPKRIDLIWLAKGGGLFTKGVHPSSGKFNAGEKVMFWLVMILGVSISVSGLSLLFPFQLNLFAPSFEILNSLGVPGLFGSAEFETALAPQEEMQFAQLWHSIIAFVYIVIIVAHIYLGTVGMEGALQSMIKGNVDEQWAKEHHDLWYEDVVDHDANASGQTPAE